MTRKTRGARRAGDEGRSNGSGNDTRDKILQAIEQHQREHGWPPSIREIGEVVGIDSTSHIAHHLAMLVKQGLLTHEQGISRGRASTRPSGVRILGRIAAGAPLDLFDTGAAELLNLGIDEIGATDASLGAAVYALRVVGQSMIEDGILDGDYVLVRPDVRVTEGAIVVAVERTGNGGQGAATVKRIVIADDHIQLDPANPAYPARRIDMQEWDRDWMVQGTVVGVYRSYDARPTAR